ncbi:MAG: DUF1415 domain-containing protein [Methylococcales bacterium]
MTTAHCIAATQAWLKNIIIGHQICPFAQHVSDNGGIHFQVDSEIDMEKSLFNLILECRRLSEHSEINTTLLIYAQGFKHFDDYLDFLALAETLLVEQGYEGIYQLASFHPDYCFDDADQHDPANYTNRSPYPMLHLLRESELEQAIAHYPDPENIPQRNINLTRELGLQKMRALLAACY